MYLEELTQKAEENDAQNKNPKAKGKNVPQSKPKTIPIKNASKKKIEYEKESNESSDSLDEVQCVRANKKQDAKEKKNVITAKPIQRDGEKGCKSTETANDQVQAGSRLALNEVSTLDNSR